MTNNTSSRSVPLPVLFPLVFFFLSVFLLLNLCPPPSHRLPPPPHSLPPPSPFSISPPTPIDFFDFGRWLWESVICNEIIVPSLALWWVLHSLPLLIYLLMRCVTWSTLKRGSCARLNKCRAIPYWLTGERQCCGRKESYVRQNSEYICAISEKEEQFGGEWEHDQPPHTMLSRLFQL